VGATWGQRPHNFLAVGAIAPIAPMESAPMGRESKKNERSRAERGAGGREAVSEDHRNGL